MAERAKPLSVTIVSGFFGAGKSAFIRRLLTSRGGRRAVTARCDSQHEIVATIQLAASEHGLEQLLLECGGACDPLSVAARFLDKSPAGADLVQLARIDSALTVVDTTDILDRFLSWNTLAEEGFGHSQDGSRLVVDVVTEQLEFANVVVLNRFDRVPLRVAQNVEMLVRALNRGARVLRWDAGEVPQDQLTVEPAFDFERTRDMAGWVQAFAAAGTEVRGVHGISSFVYRARRPFHPRRFMELVETEWPGVVRTRGYFWLASRMDWIGEIIQAGGARRHRAAGVWWATRLAGRTVEAREVEPMVGTQWDAKFGDRRQEIAFVGIDMDEATLCAQLDDCLLTDGEMRRGPEVWQCYMDPFPSWETPWTRTVDRVLN